MASNPQDYLITADQFLAMEFPLDVRVQLEDGVIRMMSGGTARHAAVQGNILTYLRNSLRGSGRTPYNSDLALRTHDLSVRYPDIAIYCGDKTAPDNDKKLAFDDPVVVIEILSPTTTTLDQRTKLNEYQALPSVETVLFVDLHDERVRVVQRTGAEGWADYWMKSGDDIALSAVEVVMPHGEIFARD